METTYPSIKGPAFDHLGQPCVAFHKHDGSNLRFLWQEAKGWFRFGTRYKWLNAKAPNFGIAMGLFQSLIGPELLATLKHHKEYRGVRNLVAFCEFFGQSSFAGLHSDDEPKELRLFDIWAQGRGFVPPKEFAQNFKHLPVAEVVYEGPFDQEFITGVRDGKFPVREGVVAKGTFARRDKTEIWRAKVKTQNWLAELARRSAGSDGLREQLAENLREQGAVAPESAG